MSTPTATPDAPATDTDKALVPAPASTPAVKPTFDFDPGDPVALYMDTGIFEQLQRVAVMMSKAGTVPQHLREKVADCFLVAAQAFRWRMDPFAVAQHTYVVSGKLGYEGKLVAAVLNSNPRISRRLDYAYSGAGQERKVVVTARLRDEEKDRSIEGTVAQWATTTDDKWKKNPDQMLAYRGAREWARRHAPEILLGVATDDELPRETVTLERDKSGAFAAAPPATPDPLLAAASAASTPVELASHSEKEIPLHAADAPGAEKEPPTIVHPPVTPPPAPEPTGTGQFAKAVEDEKKKRGGQGRLVE